MPRTAADPTLRQRGVALTDTDWQLVAKIGATLTLRGEKGVTRAGVIRRAILRWADDLDILGVEPAPRKKPKKSPN